MRAGNPQTKPGKTVVPPMNPGSDNQGLDNFGMEIHPHRDSGLPPAPSRVPSHYEHKKNRHGK